MKNREQAFRYNKFLSAQYDINSQLQVRELYNQMNSLGYKVLGKLLLKSLVTTYYPAMH